MALKIKPPQHAVDAPGELVIDGDDAWDHDRIEREKAELPDGNDHPVERYWAGETRYDLDALGVRSYLDPSKQPVIFKLRRLSGTLYRQLQSKWDADRLVGFHEAARFGLQDIEGAPYKLRGKSQLTQADLDWLTSQGLDVAVGIAVLNFAAPLTDAEKKP